MIFQKYLVKCLIACLAALTIAVGAVSCERGRIEDNRPEEDSTMAKSHITTGEETSMAPMTENGAENGTVPLEEEPRVTTIL